MGKRLDLKGKKFTRLTVVDFDHINPRGHAMWKCKCDCGNEELLIARGSHLVDGNVTSCGCAPIEKNLARFQASREEMIGKVFGRLTVERVSHIKDNHTAYFECRCSCGNSHTVSRGGLRNGTVTSCGCYAREVSSEVHSTHGLSYHPLYGTWRAMLSRCYEPNDVSYEYYGGKGISVCEEWRNNIHSFIAWAEANGQRPGLSIERIDNDGNYEPGNCRWGTVFDQARNTRRNVIKDMTMARAIRNDPRPYQDIAHQYGIHRSVVASIKEGKTWSEDAPVTATYF